jgi:hypothetical protein
MILTEGLSSGSSGALLTGGLRSGFRLLVADPTCPPLMVLRLIQSPLLTLSFLESPAIDLGLIPTPAFTLEASEPDLPLVTVTVTPAPVLTWRSCDE